MTSAILTKLSKTYSEALTNPEKYLGPNYLKVLEFWEKIENLSEQEKCDIDYYYDALDELEDSAESTAACVAAEEVVGEDFSGAAWDAASDVTNCRVFAVATCELIGDVKNKVAYDFTMSRVFTQSESFSALTKLILGPNYDKVLKFWSFSDKFNAQQKRELDNLYWTLSEDVLISAKESAKVGAEEVVYEEFKYVVWGVVSNATRCPIVAWATYELIGNVENKVFYDLIMSYKKS